MEFIIDLPGKHSIHFICEISKPMYSTPVLLRLAKAIAVAAIGLMAFLVAFGNITDYYSNYFFIAHVLKMDTTFPQSHLHYRSINNMYVFHAAYILIMTMESVVAFCCIKGSWVLFKNLKSSAAKFHASKNWAIAGIIIGIVIWFAGFEVIGGEWFAMWQSASWNGLLAAARIVSFLVLVLLLLHLKEDEI
jgi:predicted small integral membrane protein